MVAVMSTSPPRTCGSCSLCCKILRIDELEKPMGSWCPHHKAGQGCTIYGSHPQSCRNYQCLWLISPTMPDSVRPDRSKVVLEVDNNGARILARCDPASPPQQSHGRPGRFGHYSVPHAVGWTVGTWAGATHRTVSSAFRSSQKEGEEF